MYIQRFEDIIAWQKAKLLTVDIYKSMHSIKDFGFRDQIQRASVSIMNNIAEGFERRGDKEFKHFLYISKGSCGEVRSMLILAHEMRLLPEDSITASLELTTEISKLLGGLIKSLT